MDNNEFPEIERLMRRENDKELIKEAMKEAFTEWLDRQFRNFGRWTAIGISTAAFALLVKFIVMNDIFPGK